MNSDDRKLLLAFILSLIVFLGYQSYITKYYPPSPRSSTQSPAADTGIGHADVSVPPAPPLLPFSPASLAVREETAVLTADEFEITTTTAGAGVRQIHLRGIPRLPHKDLRDVALVDESGLPQAGIQMPGQIDMPQFSVQSVSAGKISYIFEARRPQGDPDPVVRIERTISLTGRKYEIQMQTVIRNVSPGVIHYGADSSSAIGLTLPPLPAKRIKSDLDIHEFFVKLGEDVEHRQEKRPGFFGGWFAGGKKAPESRREVLEGALRWMSLGDRYFTITLVSDTPLARVLLSIEGPSISALAQYGSLTLTPGQEKRFEERLYAGPKIPVHLKAYGQDLLDIMNFGWFDWLGFWMLWLMQQSHRVFPNFGVSIIFLTVIVRIVLYPLTYKSYVSMAKLKELAPKMKAVQEKYKDNKEKLNKEMIRLYKENKVNPAGGCLPIFLQIPVFIAFYRMLQYAIELRGASFLWVSDLSEKDPYFVLPILMGVAMLIQQKLTPTPDPNQAKIGMFMTVIFTFMFLTFPAGLNLYWFVSTVLGIWQQKIIEKKLKPPVAAA